jgi:5-formyltetrahydrofolate cyclo-ligase
VCRVVVDRPVGIRGAKRRLRFQLLAARAQRPSWERLSAADALAQQVLAIPEVERAGSVACYVSTPEEPGTGPLLDALSARSRTILLPVLRPDFDLDWAAYEPGALRAARFGISEPSGPPLGLDAVTAADVVICPGLAVDGEGHRMGRGGGSYDRVLSRVPDSMLRVVLVYDDEVLAAVPTDQHDEPVQVVVTPTRTLRLRPPSAPASGCPSPPP